MRQETIERPGTRDAGDTVDWVRPPVFMLRIAGLGVRSVAPLRAPAVVDWAERVLGIEDALAAGKDALADRLQEAVGGLDDEVLRRRLLQLRRDVFNLRAPRDPDGVTALADGLSRDLAGSVRDWLGAREELDRQRSAGEALLAGETVRARGHLRELAADPVLRCGLLLASPSLDRYLDGYLAADAARLPKRARRIERSLLEYVWRTACKTSPFSTLTTVALGRFESGVDSLLELDPPSGPPRSHVRLNLAVLARIVTVLTSDPVLRGDLPVEVTRGWRRDRDRIRYVRLQHHSGDDDASVSMDTLSESLFYLASSSVLHEVFDVLPDGERLTFARLAEHLMQSPAERRDRGQVESYLGHLLRLGLLVVPGLHVDIHDPDPLRSFRSAVRDLDVPWAARLADQLDTVADAVDGYAGAELPRRRELLELVRRELGDAQGDLGAVEATVPRTLLYEDVRPGTGTPPRAGTEAWDEVLTPALSGLARMLPVFDITLPQRLVTRGYFLARYGRDGVCDDLVRFVHEFDRDFNDQYQRSLMRRREFDEDNEYTALPNWLGQPELDALDDARRALVGHMRRRYADHPGDDVELVLDDDVVDDVAARLPDCLGEIDPHCFFLQVGRDGDRPFAVLNRAYSGLTLQFSRFAHCFPDDEGHGLTDGLRSTLDAVCPDGAVFAELTGGYQTTNLNLHPSVTPYELVCPGEVSFRPPSEQIPVDDLYVVDDPAARRLRLRSRTLGVEVVPVYLGFLVPMALPDMQRLLLGFSYTSMARIDLWSGVDRPLGDAPIGGHPRVRYRNLVLTRRLWKTHPRHLPDPAGRTEAEQVLAWTRWRRDNGLPRRVFVTPDLPTPEERDEDPGGRPAAAGTTKPQYVDFDSPFSLSLLDHTVRSATHRLVFTEMLPDLDHLWSHPGGEPYVTELTVEMDGVPRRTR